MRPPQIKQICNEYVQVAALFVAKCKIHLEEYPCLPEAWIPFFKITSEFLTAQRKVKLDEYRALEKVEEKEAGKDKSPFASLSSDELVKVMKEMSSRLQ